MVMLCLLFGVLPGVFWSLPTGVMIFAKDFALENGAHTPSEYLFFREKDLVLTFKLFGLGLTLGLTAGDFFKLFGVFEGDFFTLFGVTTFFGLSKLFLELLGVVWGLFAALLGVFGDFFTLLGVAGFGVTAAGDLLTCSGVFAGDFFALFGVLTGVFFTLSGVFGFAGVFLTLSGVFAGVFFALSGVFAGDFLTGVFTGVCTLTGVSSFFGLT
jgi:hypothetical protein